MPRAGLAASHHATPQEFSMATDSNSDSLKRREFLTKTGSGLLAAVAVPAGAAWAGAATPNPAESAAFPPVPSRTPGAGAKKNDAGKSDRDWTRSDGDRNRWLSEQQTLPAGRLDCRQEQSQSMGEEIRGQGNSCRYLELPRQSRPSECSARCKGRGYVSQNGSPR